MNRRTRQFLLFLAAVVLPAAALSVLTFRYLHQDEEMARRLEPGQRRDAADQAQRELAVNLDAIRLQAINRRVQPDDSTTADPADPAIVFAVALDKGRLIFPWESARMPGYPTARFISKRDEGQLREFQSGDFAAAAAQYQAALVEVRQLAESCEARLALSRALLKGKKQEEALGVVRDILGTCGATMDDQGMPYTLYAAERLISLKLDLPLAEEYLVHLVHGGQLREIPYGLPLVEPMIRSLLQSIGTISAKQALAEHDQHLANFAQVLALQKDLERVQPLAEKEWIAYGAEPWLLKVTPVPPGLPLMLAISSSKVAPPGTKLVSAETEGSYMLGQGFSGLAIELDPNRSFSGDRAPAFMIAGGIALILILTILSGYLFIHGVNRDLQMAEMRSHFVASVSHELKTPITAIRMFAETLSLGRMNNEQARSEYLETIVNESERLARLVDNVLDFSKIEQGKKIYRMRPTALPEVVRSAARAMHYPLSQQGFNLNVSIDEDLPAMPADADALEQAILNLLSNAVKYSGEGREIDLCCARRNGHAVIAVSDRGIGIAAEDQARVFEKFYRVRGADTELIAGTGLGLTLVKHIAQAHGGSVEVESAPGKGSTFSIRIPADISGKGEAST